MGQLIHDIQPLTEMPSYLRGYGKQGRIAKSICDEVLISELHRRGVTIETIFGQYYALDEMASHSTLTVGDARLAGFGTPAVNYNQPF